MPAHGEMADASIIREYRGYLQALRTRVAELKGQGRSAEETAELRRGELRAKYPDWAQPLRIVGATHAVYAELP